MKKREIEGGGREADRRAKEGKQTHLSNLNSQLLLPSDPSVLFLSIHKLSSSLLLLDPGLLLWEENGWKLSRSKEPRKRRKGQCEPQCLPPLSPSHLLLIIPPSEANPDQVNVHRKEPSASCLPLCGKQPDPEEARKMKLSKKEEEAEAEGSFARLLRREVRLV